METLWVLFEYPDGGGSTRQNVIRGRITPYPFIYFDRNGTPLVYVLFANCTPFTY